MIGVTAD